MEKLKNSLVKSKIISEKSLKIISLVFTYSLIVIFIAMLGFIIWKASDAFNQYGIVNILFTGEFNFNGPQVSFWVPFSITLLTTFIAILIAAPIGIKTAMFIKFRVQAKYRKILRLIIETLAGIPSVIFGLFASHALGEFVKLVFNIDSSYSILNASIMLAFMILPTIIAISYNSLQSVDNNLLTNPIAVGSSKTRAMYKVYKKAAKSGIVVGVILAVGRAIGEAMALSMVLQSQDYSQISSGFISVLVSDLKTISTIISYNMFADSTSEVQKSLLFAFGLILFIVVGLINVLILYVTRKKVKFSSNNKFLLGIHRVSFFFSDSINVLKCKLEFLFSYWEKWTFFNKRKIIITNADEAIAASKIRIEKYKLKNSYSYYKIFWEWISVTICLLFLSWLLLDILINGGTALTSTYQSMFSYTRNTTGQALFNTILIIIVAIGISFPLSLIISIYLIEFSKSKSFKKLVTFFLDALGSTPSILFGLFGLVLFIQTFGWTANGVKGNSLIAGALTIGIVILPSFIRAINHALISVPIEARKNAYALGSSKTEVVRKVVIPYALTGITTSVILAISRIFAESAPLYLTAGLSASNFSVLDRPGQTLTTRIFNQLTNTNVEGAYNIMYESAFLLILLILSLVIIAYVIIPNWRQIKKWFLVNYLITKEKTKTFFNRSN